MKKIQIIISIILVIACVMGCKDDTPQELTIEIKVEKQRAQFDWIEVSINVAKSGGDDMQHISKKGICYSLTNKNPTIENSTVVETDFRIELPPNTSVYIRGFAIIEPIRDIDQAVYYSEVITHATLADLPVISKVFPLKGYFGDTVIINGSGFSSFFENTVYFNNTEAQIIEYDSSKFVVLVPRKAGKGKIQVKVRNTIINGPQFDFQQDTDDIYTLCGKQESGFADGSLKDALFNNPYQLIFDKNGNLLIADRGNHRIRKITPDGQVSTFAGSGVAGYMDGPAASAQFNGPVYLAEHPVTGDIYVTEYESHCIRKISADGTTVSTFKGIANQPGDVNGSSDRTDISFNQPRGIVFNSKNELFVADYGNHRIRKINTLGTTSTFAGYGDPTFMAGNGINASIGGVWWLTIDKDDNLHTFFTYKASASWVKKMVLVTPNADVRLYMERDIPGASSGIILYDSKILIPYVNCIYKIDHNNTLSLYTSDPGEYGSIQPVDGPMIKAKIKAIKGITQDKNAKLYFSDGNMIRIIEKIK